MRVLVIEDEPELGQLIVSNLAKAGFVADLMTGVEDGQSAISVTRFDAIILDLGLPDGDGMDVLKDLRVRHNATPVLILTARDAPSARVAGLDAGADDYLVKPFFVDELVARIKALLRRPGHALGIRMEMGNLIFDTISRQAEVGGQPLSLGRREALLLERLLRRQGQVVPKDGLEESLYGFEDDPSSNAVEVVVHRLRRKLSDAHADTAIHTLRGVGYLLATKQSIPGQTLERTK